MQNLIIMLKILVREDIGSILAPPGAPISKKCGGDTTKNVVGHDMILLRDLHCVFSSVRLQNLAKVIMRFI